MMPNLTTIAVAGLGMMLAVPAFCANSARPGTVNYIEGAAYLNGQQLTGKSVGSTDLNPGEELSTQTGKAEILLTPGVFLRLDDNSEVKMISPDLTKTQVELEHGRAGIEVDEPAK
jgi:FecR protein